MQLLDRRSDSDSDDVSSHKLTLQLLSLQQDLVCYRFCPPPIPFVFPSPIVDDGSCIFNVALCCLLLFLLLKVAECLTDKRKNLSVTA